MKVTDYGLAMLVNKGYTAGASLVEVTTDSAGAAGPTRWMAPESILRRIYSKKTDVWALGVLLYEVWTLAIIPYYLISDDREVARMVVDGERLQQPDSCPDHVYVIMQECWRRIQKDRPSMPEIQTRLQEAFVVESLGASKTECVVCLSAESVMALMPCGHRCACEECGPGLKRNLPHVQSRCARGQAHFRLGRQGYRLLDLRKAHQASVAMPIHDYSSFIAHLSWEG